MVASTSVLSSGLDTQTLKTAWRTISWQSCPNHYNFHLHTHCSDGQLTPQAVIKQSLEIGLKGLAITDHHSVAGYYIAQSYIETLERPSPQLWTGIEITADLADIEVHLLGYGFNPQHPVLVPYLQGYRPQGRYALAQTVIDALHQAGGLVILAHPERYYRPAKDLIPLAADLGIDGVEAYYAYGNPKPWQPSPKETETVLQLGSAYHLFYTCGTDSHGKSLLQRI